VQTPVCAAGFLGCEHLTVFHYVGREHYYGLTSLTVIEQSTHFWVMFLVSFC